MRYSQKEIEVMFDAGKQQASLETAIRSFVEYLSYAKRSELSVTGDSDVILDDMLVEYNTRYDYEFNLAGEKNEG